MKRMFSFKKTPKTKQRTREAVKNRQKLLLVSACNVSLLPPECPVELLLRGATGRHVDGQEELLEVDETVLVTVEGPEDVLTELSRAAQQLFWS